VVVAIAGTAWVAWFTVLRPANYERTHRANVLVFRLLPFVAEINETAARVRTVVQQTDYGCMLAAAGQLEKAEWSLRIDTGIPDAMMSEIHVFDSRMSEITAKLYYLHLRHNQFVKASVPLLRSLPANELADYRGTFETIFADLEATSEKALALLRSAVNKKSPL
jgi:hypothetical protein